MLIMLIYFVIVLGIIVNASDTPQLHSRYTEILLDNSDGSAKGAVLTNGQNSDILHTMPVGFSMLATESQLDLNGYFESVTFESFDYQSLYQNAWSLCIDSLWSTCVGRCGSELWGAPYVCACDPLCPAYGDCCLDYELECTMNGPYVNASQETGLLTHMGHMACISLASDYDYGVLFVVRCADWWPVEDPEAISETNHIRKLCESPMPGTFLPIEGGMGIVYKNIQCAICNDQKFNPNSVVKKLPVNCSLGPNDEGATYQAACHLKLTLSEMRTTPYRVCAYDINECPTDQSSSKTDHRLITIPDSDQVDAKFNDLCEAYSKPLFRDSLIGGSTVFKNVHCAHCNKMVTAELFCPSWKLISTSRNSDTSGPMFFFETGENAANKYEIRDIPASFAILFYFGTDGGQNSMFSSQSKEWWEETLDNCEENQIWDPFTEICRNIYCSAEFTLVDFKCVDIYGNDTVDYNDGQTLPENITDALQFMDLTQVQVILDIQLDCCVDNVTEQILADQFVDALAASLNVSVTRFANFTIGNSTQQTVDNQTVTDCPQQTSVSVILLSPPLDGTKPEPSIEKIMASLSYSISLNHLLLHLEAGITIRTIGLQEKVIQYSNATSNNTEEWCPNGRQLYYTTGQFTPITTGTSVDNMTLYMYVNATGYTYLPGEFIANFLFQGNQRSVLANVTGALVVCDHSSDNNTCVRIMLDSSEFTPLENGSLLYTGNESISTIYNPGSYEILPSGDALVCISLPPWPNGTEDELQSGYYYDIEIQSVLTTILLCLSSLAMLCTILTYIFFSQLRNLPGWNMINLTFCLLIYQIIYLAGMRSSVTSNPTACKTVAISLHFFMLAFFFWMNVMAYDVFQTFSRKSLLAVTSREMKYFPRYALYAYGMPLVIVSGCVAVDMLNIIPNVWIGYGGGEACWIANPTALAVTFAAPTAAILIVNFAFYLITVCSIRKIRRKTKLTTGQRNGKSQLVIYIRMSTVMGFTWIFGYLSGIPNLPYSLHDIFSYLFIFLNTFQGAFIFLAFGCNKKVYNLYRKSRIISGIIEYVDQFRKCRECHETTCVCQKPVVRTISNETCQSVVMDENDEKPPACINEVDLHLH